MGHFDLNEYVARVLQREVLTEPEEAAKAFTIAIRTYLFQNATRKEKGLFINDSSHEQRVSLEPPSREALRLSLWTDALILDGVKDIRYHSNKPSLNRLAWSEAKRDAFD